MDANTRQTLSHDGDEAKAVRFCFRFKAQDIPGEPGARSITLANAFMKPIFGREFGWATDHVYTPAGIDEVEEGNKRKLYMLLDVNKNANTTFESLYCYQVTKGNPITFKETNFNGVRGYLPVFPWGGRDGACSSKNKVDT